MNAVQLSQDTCVTCASQTELVARDRYTLPGKYRDTARPGHDFVHMLPHLYIALPWDLDV